MNVSAVPPRQFTILQDLSLASLGFSGIPQDTRLMFKTFATMEGAKVTGLLSEHTGGHSSDVSTRAHAAEPSRDYLEASLFMMAASGLPVKNPPRLMRFPRRVTQRAVRTFKTFRTRPLAKGLYEDSIWRTYFQKTLASSDRALVAEQDFAFTNLSVQLLNERMALPFFNPPVLDTRGFDFLVTSDARPFRPSPGTTLILRYHDPIPMAHPDTMDNADAVRQHYLQIERSRHTGYFVCNSKATEEALVDIFPAVKNRATTIPYALPDAPPPPPRAIPVAEIIRTRLSPACVAEEKQPTSVLKGVLQRANIDKPFRYIMWLTSLEPKKNTIGVIRAWERVKYTWAPDLKLIIAGKPAWRYHDILRAMKGRFLEGELLHVEDLPFVEIQSLYRSAECFVFPSFAEGFGFPPMEAMQCGTASVVSDIPAHRWVMEDAVLYADPYDDQSIANQIRRLVVDEGRMGLREQLIANGKRVLERYKPQRVGEQWLELFTKLKRDGVLPQEFQAREALRAAG